MANSPMGLNIVACGIAVIVSDVAHVYWRQWFDLLGLLPWMAVLLIALVWIPRYYSRRFGPSNELFGPAPTQRRTQNRRLLIVGGPIFLALCVMVGFLQHLPCVAVDLFKPLILLAFPGLLLLAPYGDLRPTASIALMTVIAVVAAMLHLLPLWVSFGPRQLTLWRLFDASGAGICLVLIGLCDHVSLTSLVTKRQKETA